MKANLYISRSRYIHDNRCRPPRRHPQTDLSLGLDLLTENVRMVKARYHINENTFQTYMAKPTYVNKIEPKNAQTVEADECRIDRWEMLSPD